MLHLLTEQTKEEEQVIPLNEQNAHTLGEACSLVVHEIATSSSALHVVTFLPILIECPRRLVIEMSPEAGSELFV